ncbi:MAG: oligoendopeptidase F, partial [Lachnospiraceae bacterium]|nr:oligoendopeptidase F [Lachnospiraceae bacterium]
MADNKILTRAEVPEPYTWNLKDIFESDEACLQALEELKGYPEKIEAFRGKLGESKETLLAFYQLSDELEVKLSKMSGYTSMKSDEDTANAVYLDLKGKAMTVFVQIMSSAAFSDSEIMAIPEETLQDWFAACPELTTYKRPIEKIRKQAEHILPPAEEALLASVRELSEASENIAGMLRNADMKWGDVTDSEGNVYPLTNGSFVPLQESSDRAFREQVFKAFYENYKGLRNTIAATLDGQFKSLLFFSKARHYTSTLEAALSSTEVPESVYLNLIEAVHQNLDKMYRYVRLRKKLLGVDELHMYDVYTPIVSDFEMKISFEEAKKTVLEALKVLGSDYTDLLKEGFENRWIDVYENVGKRGGAYSSGSSRPHPYVLLNHKDNLDSVFTLAHEMGHALHSWHSTKHQPIATADYVIFVAEVASTVNEVLLNHYLLDHATDKTERAYIINHFLEGFKGTVYRQTMFAEFELMMGHMAENAETLTADALFEKYLALNKLYFGPDMVSDEEIGYEWARIPHFFYNYYVFQYATGYSAAVAIANRILKEGETAVQDYKKFLSSGSTMDPISLLKIA